MSENKDDLKNKLTPEEYYVTQNHGTEPAFSGEFDKNYAPGTYHCVVCGTEIFSSEEKYDSGSGWPSFWKPSIDDNCGWKSPWGFGRPGWHIECTSMIKNIIGNDNTLDFHGGGNDLIFPHHENEIAQGSCCSSATFCNYWFHNGIVLVNKKKMSKSLGNVILVSDILRQYNPAVIRLALMSTQYRQPLNWTKNMIINAENILQKISKSLDNNKNTHNQKDEEFIKLLCDDLNTPNAIQYLVKQAKLAKNNNEELAKLRYNCDLIGINNNKVKSDISVEDEEVVKKLVIERELARKNKDFAQADLIRDKLASLNVDLEDTPDGATWKIKH